MIVVRQFADEASRTPNNSCYWQAECVVDGLAYVARSRHGAPYALARELLAAGIPDAPMQVTSAGRAR